MRSKLMLGGAIAALSLVPMSAYADGSVHETNSSHWDNRIDVALNVSVSVTKDLDINGDISISGSVDIDALAQATLDNKQIMKDNEVQFEDYQHVYVPTQYQWEPDPGTSTAHAATYTNSVDIGNNTLSGATGNIGLNVASGDYNMQDNAAVIASALSDDPNLDGGAEAESFSLQSLYNNDFNDESADFENTVISNRTTLGSGALNGASGNIGVNGASGAFNQQKNALAMASVDSGILAEAHAGIDQSSHRNDAYHENTTNTAAVGSALVLATGNIGVNLAAGVGNQQINSLTIASAILQAPPGPGNSGGGGSGGPPEP